MQDYAVIQIAHRQHMVQIGRTYTVDKFVAEVGTKMDFPVLAMAKDGKLTIGTPVVEKTSAKIEVLEQGRGEKINTFVYKAKSRYHKRHGFRKQITTFKVIEIN